MAKQSTTITTLPRSPEDDRRARMFKYSVMMLIRVVCIGLCLVAQGWWLLICVFGAVFLPYFAVILANAVDSRVTNVERPVSMPFMITAQTTDEAEHSDDEGDSEDVHTL